MIKLIHMIFLPMVLSGVDRTMEKMHTIEAFDTQPRDLGSSNLESVVLIFASANVTCPCDRKIDGVQRKDDYQHTPGIGHHKLHTRGLTFNNARKICYEEGGHLAIINSLQEEQVLLEMINHSRKFLSDSNQEQVFIGIHDLFSEGEWVTVLGDPLSRTGYSKWSDTWWSGQPDNYAGNQNCGTLLQQGGMDDVDCNSVNAFICEIPEV